MLASSMTSKGQITIPAELRRKMGLKPGDRVAFIIEHDRVVLVRQEDRIEAAFGLVKADHGVSLEAMDRTIRERAGR